jgi:hypothetical protein
MQRANQDLCRLRQPNLLPFSASERCYPGNLGSNMNVGTKREPNDQWLKPPGCAAFSVPGRVSARRRSGEDFIGSERLSFVKPNSKFLSPPQAKIAGVTLMHLSE